MLQAVYSFIRFIEVEKRYSVYTVISYKKDLEDFTSFLEKEYAVLSLKEITTSMIRTWVVSLSENQFESTTIHRKLSAVKSFFKYLISKRAILANPCFGVQSIKGKKRLPKFVQEKALKNLFRTPLSNSSFQAQRDRLVIDILYTTGVRKSELIYLKETDIDMNACTIKVWGKGSKERIIPIHSNLLDTIKSYMNIKQSQLADSSSPYLLVTNKGNKMYPKFVYNTVKRYLSSYAGTPNASPHVLRHSFATHMLNRGADINAIKDLLGHASLASTQVYTHNTVDKLKKVYKQAHPKSS